MARPPAITAPTPIPCWRADAARVRDRLEDGLDVYVYFNNDGGGAAVRNALRLREMLTERAL